MAAGLSERQVTVLRFIREYWGRRLTTPTQREVAAFLGVKTASGAARHLIALHRKGYLEHDPKAHRGYRLALTDVAVSAEGPEPVAAGDVQSAREVVERTVPMVGRVPGGSPSLQDLEDLGEVVSPVRVSRRAFAVRVFGDSMRDAHIIDGDVVVVDPLVLAVDRRVVVALVDGKYTVKTLRRISDGDWWLEPANDQHKPILPRMEGDRVEGVVVAVLRERVAQRRPASSW